MAESPTQARGPQQATSSRIRSRGSVFALFAIMCVVTAGAYVVWAVRRDGSAKSTGDSGRVSADTPEAASLANAGPKLLFSNRSRDHNLRAAVVTLESPEGPRGMTTLTCQRIHYAGGHGLCLGEGGGTAAVADVLSTHGY